jgi:hypothetical protein
MSLERLGNGEGTQVETSEVWSGELMGSRVVSIQFRWIECTTDLCLYHLFHDGIGDGRQECQIPRESLLVAVQHP